MHLSYTVEHTLTFDSHITRTRAENETGSGSSLGLGRPARTGDAETPGSSSA